MPGFIFLTKQITKGGIQFRINCQIGHAFLILDRQSGTIGDGFVQPVSVDVVSGTFATCESLKGVFVILGQWCAGKGDKLGIGQAGSHKGGKETILTAMGFIDQHVKVGLGGQHMEVHGFPTLLHPLVGFRCAIRIKLSVVNIQVFADIKLTLLMQTTHPGMVFPVFSIFIFGSGLDGFAIPLLKLMHGAGEYTAVVVRQHLLQSGNRGCLDGT